MPVKWNQDFPTIIQPKWMLLMQDTGGCDDNSCLIWPWESRFYLLHWKKMFSSIFWDFYSIFKKFKHNHFLTMSQTFYHQKNSFIITIKILLLHFVPAGQSQNNLKRVLSFFRNAITLTFYCDIYNVILKITQNYVIQQLKDNLVPKTRIFILFHFEVCWITGSGALSMPASSSPRSGTTTL